VTEHTKAIIIVRHGRPLLESCPDMHTRVTGHGYNAYIREYDQCTVDPSHPPPPELIETVRTASRCVSSDLRRARDSAALITPREIEFRSSLREAALPPTTRVQSYRPLGLWMLSSRVRWLFGMVGQVETRRAFVRRIECAATELDQEATRDGPTVVVAHGLTNRYLARSLTSLGWRPREESHRHWGVTRVTRP
jgi:broad specificity phosphatase PhoE